MTNPIGPYLDAAIPALRTALGLEGYSNPSKRVVSEAYQGIPFPYVLVDGGAVVPWSTKTSEGGEITPLFTVWAKTHDECLSVANVVMATLTSRSAPILPDGYTLGPWGLDIAGPVIRQEAGGSTVQSLWGYPIRMRVMLMESPT